MFSFSRITDLTQSCNVMQSSDAADFIKLCSLMSMGMLILTVPFSVFGFVMVWAKASSFRHLRCLIPWDHTPSIGEVKARLERHLRYLTRRS